MSGEAIKIAIRVRSFFPNGEQGQTCCIKMVIIHVIDFLDRSKSQCHGPYRQKARS